MCMSVGRLWLYIKSLDNAVRLTRDSRETGFFVIGLFPQKHMNRFVQESPVWFHEDDLPLVDISLKALPHMHTQVRIV